jgi:L-ascorbate metabolism protein UlaG (beta-lactamase superfamily)
LGPFDLTIIKVGAYGPGQMWKDIHMPPEKSIQTHKDVNGRAMLPVHWGTFDLGNHEWDEPIIRTFAAAEKTGTQLVTPKPGEMVDPTNHRNINWWEGID